MRIWTVLVFAAAALVPAAVAVTACSSQSPKRQTASGGGGSTSAGGSGAALIGGGAGVAGTTPGTGGTVSLGGAGGSGALDPDAACEGVSQQAEDQFQPADIVWAIDTSGSMIDEAQAVQMNVNAFSQQIVASGIDVHVVMLAAYPFGFLPGICVPAPLGSGQCPPMGSDTNLPSFWHHPAVGVDSTNGARILVEFFNDYKFMLRPEATKHVVIVTDDNSAKADGSSGDPGVYDGDPDRFIKDFTALDPMLADASGAPAWQMSGIYAFSQCMNAANVGTVWKDIIDKTGGVHGDICNCPPFQPVPCQQTFQKIFNELATKIIQGAVPLDCEWGIPPPPQGQVFDPARVNVELFDHDKGSKETVYAVPDEASCDPTLGGWYYDDPVNPTRVIACPASCDHIKSVQHGRVDVAFGCATIVIPK